MDLVCGSDGQTYINDCVMRTKSCKAEKKVLPKRKGYCGKCRSSYNNIQVYRGPQTAFPGLALEGVTF